VVKENVGSKKLFEKCGFVLEGIGKEEFKINDKFLDMLYFGKINNGDR
jgi:RimJ/RimL family protein N-acetyltransferase